MRRPDWRTIASYLLAALKRSAGVIRRTVPRAYALAVMALIGWTTWRAVSYLVVSLIRPSSAPAAITELPIRMDETFLRTERTAWRAIDATEHPRMPPAHYHRIDSWVHPDPLNGCTTAGCHNPIPHDRRKEVRAFLNMHATSIHCGVCHLDSAEPTLRLTWYDLDDGAARGPPAILRAYELLTAEAERTRFEQPDRALQDRMVSLLRDAAAEADGLPALEQLADHFAAVRPESAAFARLVETARRSLPRHFRGEYGAKLALLDVDRGHAILDHPATADAVREYLRGGNILAGPARDDLLNRIHPRRRQEPLSCSQCHRAESPVVNLAAAGYPAARRAALVEPIVVRMIEHIDAGTPFHLPDFIRTPPDR